MWTDLRACLAHWLVRESRGMVQLSGIIANATHGALGITSLCGVVRSCWWSIQPRHARHGPLWMPRSAKGARDCAICHKIVCWLQQRCPAQSYYQYRAIAVPVPGCQLTSTYAPMTARIKDTRVAASLLLADPGAGLGAHNCCCSCALHADCVSDVLE